VIARVGDALPGVVIIRKGSIRVEALSDVIESKGAEKIPVGELCEDDTFGTIGCLKKAQSQFSYRVASKFLRGILLPASAVVPKLAPVLNAAFLPQELEDEDRFQMVLLEELARRV
ncbi:unnamed protein product, partial [Symbiodinium pilosum]